MELWERLLSNQREISEGFHAGKATAKTHLLHAELFLKWCHQHVVNYYLRNESPSVYCLVLQLETHF